MWHRSLDESLSFSLNCVYCMLILCCNFNFSCIWFHTFSTTDCDEKSISFLKKPEYGICRSHLHSYSGTWLFDVGCDQDKQGVEWQAASKQALRGRQSWTWSLPFSFLAVWPWASDLNSQSSWILMVEMATNTAPPPSKDRHEPPRRIFGTK